MAELSNTRQQVVPLIFKRTNQNVLTRHESSLASQTTQDGGSGRILRPAKNLSCKIGQGEAWDFAYPPILRVAITLVAFFLAETACKWRCEEKETSCPNNGTSLFWRASLHVMFQSMCKYDIKLK